MSNAGDILSDENIPIHTVLLLADIDVEEGMTIPDIEEMMERMIRGES